MKFDKGGGISETKSISIYIDVFNDDFKWRPTYISLHWYSDRLQAGQLAFDSQQGKEIILYPIVSRPAVVSIFMSFFHSSIYFILYCLLSYMSCSIPPFFQH